MKSKRFFWSLLIVLVLVSSIPMPAFANYGMVSGSGSGAEDYGRIESEGLLVEIENGLLLDREDQAGVFDLCLGVLSYELKIDRRGNVLIHLLPVGEAARWLPARGYTEWGYFDCIGPQRKRKPFVGVWGYIASHKTRKHRHGWTEHRYITAGGQGFACKSRMEKGGKLHVIIYGAIF